MALARVKRFLGVVAYSIIILILVMMNDSTQANFDQLFQWNDSPLAVSQHKLLPQGPIVSPAAVNVSADPSTVKLGILPWNILPSSLGSSDL